MTVPEIWNWLFQILNMFDWSITNIGRNDWCIVHVIIILEEEEEQNDDSFIVMRNRIYQVEHSSQKYITHFQMNVFTNTEPSCNTHFCSVRKNIDFSSNRIKIGYVRGWTNLTLQQKKSLWLFIFLWVLFS